MNYFHDEPRRRILPDPKASVAHLLLHILITDSSQSSVLVFCVSPFYDRSPTWLYHPMQVATLDLGGCQNALGQRKSKIPVDMTH